MYSFSDQKGAKTLPVGAEHTYTAYIREYPPGRGAQPVPVALAPLRVREIQTGAAERRIGHELAI